jgi:hypothetical protein
VNAPEAVISADSHISETERRALIHNSAAALYGL